MLKRSKTSHNSRYTLRSSLPLVAAVLGLRHIFSKAAGQARLFAFEKTSHSGKRCMKGRALRQKEEDRMEKWKILKSPRPKNARRPWRAEEKKAIQTGELNWQRQK